MKSDFCISFRASRPLLAVLLLALTSATAVAKTAKIRDIADTVAANPILTKFAQMLLASDQATFLSSRGPFTLFAPTDSAFAKLPPGTMDALLRPENKVRLQDIVLFHVVNQKRLTAKDLIPLKSVLSCLGTPLLLKTTHSGAQLVMKGKVVHADIRCQNGLINEVDTLLMPPETSLPPLVGPSPPTAVSNATSTNTVVTVPITNAPVADTNVVPVIPVTSVGATNAAAAGTNEPPASPVVPVPQ